MSGQTDAADKGWCERSRRCAGDILVKLQATQALARHCGVFVGELTVCEERNARAAAEDRLAIVAMQEGIVALTELITRDMEELETLNGRAV